MAATRASGVSIEPVAPDALRGALLEDVYDVYCAALEIEPGHERSRFWRDQTLPRHAARDDFVFLVAREGHELVGFAYGYTGGYGQWWTDHVARALDEAQRARWLELPHFEVCELHVLPHRQRGGIGTQLLEALLTAQPHDRALLTANPSKEQPLPFYRKQGWAELAEVNFGDGYTPYVLLGKKLG